MVARKNKDERWAHLGPDGRWVAIKPRRVVRQYSIGFAMFVCFMMALAIAAGWQLYRLVPASSPSQRVASIAFGVFAIVVLLSPAAALIFVTIRELVRRFDPGLKHAGALITATPWATRVALAERPGLEEPLLEGSIEQQASQLAQLANEEKPGLSDNIDRALGDLKLLRAPDLLNGLQAARGYAAFLRIFGCGFDDIRSLEAEHFLILERAFNISVPRLWFVNDCPALLPARRKFGRGFRSSIVESGPRLYNTRLGQCLIASMVALKLCMHLQHVSGVSIPQEIKWLLDLAATSLGIVMALSLLVLWLRSLWRVRLVDGSLRARQLLDFNGEYVSLEPDAAVAVVCFQGPQSKTSSKFERRVGPPAWHFLINEAPWTVQVKNFDPRGTSWWPLVEAWEEASAPGAVPPDGPAPDPDPAEGSADRDWPDEPSPGPERTDR